MKSATTKKVWQPKQIVSISTSIKQVMADSVYRPRNEIWPMNCSSSSLDNFGPEDYFLACKHCHKKQGAHMLMIKIGSNLSNQYSQAI